MKTSFPSFCLFPPMAVSSSNGKASPVPSTTTASAAALKALKICAVTSASDAKMITSVVSHYIPAHVELFMGMILWPNSKRSISMSTAREISSIAKDNNMTPVAVFVDETHEQIVDICHDCDVSMAQLHGDPCRTSWEQHDHGELKWIDVRDVSENGTVSRGTLGKTDPMWTIFDAKGGGTGTPFDWRRFEIPKVPWLLAGGLHPGNVEQAIETLQPTGLDVASGVAGPDKIGKDENRLYTFLHRVVQAYDKLYDVE